MLYQVYCDESCQTGAKFMAIGGIIILEQNLKSFNASMARFRTEQKMTAELKWTKVSNQKLAEYRRFVDFFFEVNDAKKAHFHALLVESSKVNHAYYSGGDKEAGFYKFYYQLLLHRFGKRYCSTDPEARFQLILDHRTSSYPLGKLRTILNHGMKSRHKIATRPFVSVEPRDSKQSEVLQINDIILGAIAFHKNGMHNVPGIREAKKELAAYIAAKTGLKNLTDDTPFGSREFTIWNIRLQ